jgi:nucleotide-binding universal stress UspA family protein
MTYDEILLASDGSDAAEAATDHALLLAEAFDAKLHVIYVLDVAEPSQDVDDSAEHPDLKAKRERALEYPVEQAERADITVTSVTMRGSPSDALVTYAGQEDIDLIVMGTHGRSGFDRLLVGSVAERVVRNAPAPVVTVRPDQKGGIKHETPE